MTVLSIAHWLASLVVLSVVCAHLEKLTPSFEFMSWVPRAAGWVMLGGAALDGVFSPFFGHGCAADRFGFIGFGLLAISYKWDGASTYEGVRRRATDH